MSTWKITKAIMLAQLMWLTLVGVITMVVALFATKDKVPSKKMTKDGFHTPEMQSIYDRYVNKEMKYGQS